MNIKKWLISAVTLTFALGTLGAITAFAMTSDGGSDKPEVPDSGDTAGKALHGDPTYEQWLSDHGSDTVATSIDDIDPNVCNYIHNITACTPEELEELGNLAAISWIVDPDTVVEGEPEPLFVDGEPVTKQECELAGGTVWASSDGKVGCDIVNDLEDGGDGETQAQPPVVRPEPEPLPAK